MVTTHRCYSLSPGAPHGQHTRSGRSVTTGSRARCVNFYQLHIGDYVAATAHLSWDEDLAYRRLMDAYYAREQPIPAELAQACRIIRAEKPAHRAAVKAVLEEFFDLTDRGWVQKRCEQELERYADKRANARTAAQHSVNARRTKAERTLNGTSNGRSADVEQGHSTDVELPVLKQPELPPVAPLQGGPVDKSVDNPPNLGPWWRSDHGVEAMGKALGMQAKPSESYESYKARIFESLSERRGRA
jgi:uncharacterized protein YdaU (DUF1376 family)